MEGNVSQLVGSFIAIAILLAVGIQVLGNAVQDCTSLPGNATAGWQGTCETGQTQTIDAYGLLGIILIVIAAVAILFVVKLL
jgi:hypothetical protein